MPQKRKPVPKPETSKIFVGNLQKDVTSALLREQFDEDSDVQEVISKNDFAFITFKSKDGAARAADRYHGKECWGATMIVEVIKPPVTVNPDGSKKKPKRPLYKPNLSKHPKHKGKPTETKHVLYVANVSRYVTWQDLKDVMSLCGRVCSCHVHRKRKGFGEVYYADAQGVKDAMKFLTGFEMQGRPLSFLTKAAFEALPPVEPKPRKVYTKKQVAKVEEEEVAASDDKSGPSSSGAQASAPVEMEIDSAMHVMKRLQAQDPAKVREMLQAANGNGFVVSQRNGISQKQQQAVNAVANIQKTPLGRSSAGPVSNNIVFTTDNPACARAFVEALKEAGALAVFGGPPAQGQSYNPVNDEIEEAENDDHSEELNQLNANHSNVFQTPAQPPSAQARKPALVTVPRGSRQNQKKAPNKKPPKSGYHAFYAQQYPQLRAACPAASLGQMSQEIGKRWRGLGKNRQRQYGEHAAYQQREFLRMQANGTSGAEPKAEPAGDGVDTLD